MPRGFTKKEASFWMSLLSRGPRLTLELLDALSGDV